LGEGGARDARCHDQRDATAQDRQASIPKTSLTAHPRSPLARSL
jgi:hypothetical protein